MRSVVAPAVALLVAAAPVSAAEVTLVGAGGPVALSASVQAAIADIVKREAESCSLNSVGYPDILGRDAAPAWREAEARPHLYLRYVPPLVILRGSRGGPPVLATEVLIRIDNPSFPHQPLTRHDGVVTAHAKCSGMTGIELMCQPALRPYFEKAAASNCHLLERYRN